MADILYLGDAEEGSTSLHRAEALRRLGHQATIVPLGDFCPPLSRWAGKADYLTGHRWRQGAIVERLKNRIGAARRDVVWIDSGWWCGPSTAKFLRGIADKLVLLNLDDPTGPREPRHWASLRRAAPLFDAAALVRPETVEEFRQLGAKNAIRIWRGYDEVAHAPEQADRVPEQEMKSEVVFVGTGFEDRPQFMAELIERGVPLSIWGSSWKRDRHWSRIEPHWRGPSAMGPRYVAATRRAKVCLGLLSRLNRDLHTTRSGEIPYMGGLFCAPRTSEHLAMFEDGKEAVFWDDVDDCAEICRRLLTDTELRERIRQAGSEKVRRLGIGNETVCQQILQQAGVR